MDFCWIRKSVEILEVVALVDSWHISDKDWDSKNCVDIFLVVVATIWHQFLKQSSKLKTHLINLRVLTSCSMADHIGGQSQWAKACFWKWLCKMWLKLWPSCILGSTACTFTISLVLKYGNISWISGNSKFDDFHLYLYPIWPGNGQFFKQVADTVFTWHSNCWNLNFILAAICLNINYPLFTTMLNHF